jgi:hypothetical protein
MYLNISWIWRDFQFIQDPRKIKLETFYLELLQKYNNQPSQRIWRTEYTVGCKKKGKRKCS